MDSPTINSDSDESSSSSSSSSTEVEINRLKSLLAEKDKQVREAAHLGNSLLVRLNELQSAVKSRDLELSQAHERLSQLELTNAELERKVGSTSQTNDNTNDSNQILDEFRQLSSRYELLQDQLQEATDSNKQMMRSLSERDAAIVRYQSIERENSELRNNVAQYMDQIEKLSEQLQDSNRIANEARKENSQLRSNLQDEVALRSSLQAKLAEPSESESSNSAASSKQLRELRNKLDASLTQLTEQEEQIADLRRNKRRLEEGIAGLAKEQQNLYKERDMHIRYIEDARATIAKLKQQIGEDDFSVDSTLSSLEQDEQELERSILGDLEDEYNAEQQLLIDNAPPQTLYEPPAQPEPVIDTPSSVAVAVDNDDGESTSTSTSNATAPVVEPVVEPAIPAPAVNLTPSPVAPASPITGTPTSRHPLETGAGPSAGSMDARCEEYFYLAATAIKIQMAIQSPRNSDGVFRINIKSLHDQAVQSDVPFHEWYDWLKVALHKKRAALQSSVTADLEDPINKVEDLPRSPANQRSTDSPRRSATPEPQTPPAKKSSFWFW